jgi:cytosine/adenosine deaminase-related metal-dependent hydrolase
MIGSMPKLRWARFAAAAAVLAACGDEQPTALGTPPDGAATGGAAGTSAAGAAGTPGGAAGAAGAAGTGGADAGAGGAAGTGGAAGAGATGGAGTSGGAGDASAGVAGVAGSDAGGDAPPPDAGTPATITPGAADRFLLRGTVLAPSGAIAGEVLVEGNTLTCVAVSCSAQGGAAGATVIDTNGVILPGMIDAHNHGLFDVFDESHWTPQQLYDNHNDWTNEARYGEVVDAKQWLESTSGGDVRCELDKYAELKALVAGTTSVLVAAGATLPACFGSLARTIDTQHNDLPDDPIQTSISVPTNSGANSVCTNFWDGDTDAYVVHVAEGTDQSAKNEFTTLIARGDASCAVPGGCAGCLQAPQTTIVHGTALGTPEFQTMATAGMALVWSPKSNVFLYGSTTRIDLAIAAGVQTIALGPDWSLGGSVNLLDELRFAAQIDDGSLGDVLDSERLFRMVTIDAAKALAVDAWIGSLEPGKRADLAVVGLTRADPYDSLLDATPALVRLVMVDGRVLYGDAHLSAAGPAAPGCEALNVCGASKFLCAAEASSTDKLDQTYLDVKTALETAIGSYAPGTPLSAPLLPIAPLVKCP